MIILFIDLEETVIEDANVNPPIIHENIKVVQKIIKENSIKDIDIFSFAIWDEKDKERLDPLFQRLETILGVKVCQVHLMKNVKEVVRRSLGWNTLEDAELIGFSKCRVFAEFSTMMFQHCHVILIDDTVPNMTIVNKDLNLCIEMIKVP